MFDAQRLLAGCSTLFVLAGCASSAGDPVAAVRSALPAEPLLLQVRHGGGLAGLRPVSVDVPDVSLYADGRLIAPGPQILIYPPPALPSVQVQQIGATRAQSLADRAVAAGVRPDTDFGDPRIPDATSTWITVIASGTESTVEIVAFREAADDDPDLTAAQQAARREVKALVQEIESLPGNSPPQAEPYRPDRVAVLARPHTPTGNSDAASPAPVKEWPGPALPGSEMPGENWTGCVLATGPQVERLRAAAQDASTRTAWRWQGQTWQLQIRPLLPDESQCADLT